MTFSPNTLMKITLTQTEEVEDNWDPLEEEDTYEMTWGELSSAQPGSEHYFLYRWIMGDLIKD
tara:strand:- start:2072 stop:2260 length:189 start_codon:yes stop_codon:yes gene_type:complete